MFSGNSAHELGYANAAVLTALLRALVRQQILTEHMAEDVLRDAINILKPTQMIDSVARAQAFIDAGLKAALTKKQDAA